MISLSSNKNFESYSNRNFSFSESNESDCSVFPEFPFFFKKAKELSQDDLKSQSSQCINISEQLKRELPQFDFNFGAVFYKDPVDCPGEKNRVYSLKRNVSFLNWFLL